MPAVFDPERQLTVLVDRGVDFVVIGGLAGTLHGSSAITNDADIVPRREPGNLARLAAALTELEAVIRTDADPDGVPFERSAEFLDRVDMLNTLTNAGPLDISYQPAGTSGYDDLAPRAVTTMVSGRRVLVASLDDVIRSKQIANRPKDHATLYILEALRDRLERTHRDG